MKLIIQIPCLNEQDTLAATLSDLPTRLPGIDEIETLVIDDGSTDSTSQVARENGVTHIIRFAQNRGLGHAFAAGIDFCLQQGADIIVNTDGDNQYFGGDVAKLVEPILSKRAELVIGNREPNKIEHFSGTKKFLQTFGSKVVSGLAGLTVDDAASGFKAYSREAATRLTMSTDFDHTVDHVIQAGRKRIPTLTVPIRTNDKLRESRLFNHVGQFVGRSAGIMARVYSSYGALKVFSICGIVSFAFGFAIGVRFLYYFFFTDQGSLHTQSLILGAILMLAGFQMVLTGIVADLINTNRGTVESMSYRLYRMEADLKQRREVDEDPAFVERENRAAANVERPLRETR